MTIKIIDTTNKIIDKHNGANREQKYPWREISVGKSFVVSRNDAKFGTLASLASRTGKRYGRKYSITVHETFEGFPEGCYEVACRGITIANQVINEQLEKFKEAVGGDLENMSEENKRKFENNLAVMKEIQKGTHLPPLRVAGPVTEPMQPEAVEAGKQILEQFKERSENQNQQAKEAGAFQPWTGWDTPEAKAAYEEAKARANNSPINSQNTGWPTEFNALVIKDEE